MAAIKPAKPTTHPRQNDAAGGGAERPSVPKSTTNAAFSGAAHNNRCEPGYHEVYATEGAIYGFGCLPN